MESQIFNLGGKELTVEILFEKSAQYGNRKFKKKDVKPEFKLFLKYLKKKKSSVEKSINPGIYEKLSKYTDYFEKNSKLIPDFKYYQEKIKLYLTKSLINFAQASPQIFKSDKLSIQVKIIKVDRGDDLLPEWFGALYGLICTDERAFIEISGENLMDSIVGPLFMLEKLKTNGELGEISIIEHEMQHQIGLKSVKFYDKVFDSDWKNTLRKDSMNLTEEGRKLRETLINQSAKNRAEALKDYKQYSGIPRRSGGTSLLIAAVYSIESESLSEFRELRNTNLIPIIPKYSSDFKKKLEILAQITDSKKAMKHYEDEVDIGSVDGAGTYYWAFVMCVIISLWIAKEKNQWEIFLEDKKRRQYGLGAISKLFDKGKTFYIPKIPDSLYSEAYNYIYNFVYVSKNKEGEVILGENKNPMSPVLRFKKFIQLYEYACNNLDIKRKHMPLTWDYFYELYNYSKSHYKLEYIRLVEKSGFEYRDLGSNYF